MSIFDFFHKKMDNDRKCHIKKGVLMKEFLIYKVYFSDALRIANAWGDCSQIPIFVFDGQNTKEEKVKFLSQDNCEINGTYYRMQEESKSETDFRVVLHQH